MLPDVYDCLQRETPCESERRSTGLLTPHRPRGAEQQLWRMEAILHRISESVRRQPSWSQPPASVYATTFLAHRSGAPNLPPRSRDVICHQNAPCCPPSRRISHTRRLALLSPVSLLVENPQSVCISACVPAVVTRSMSAEIELRHWRHGTRRPPRPPSSSL